ncbi:hypothetical protein PVK06_011961 [Gossypium arboreum]|uniref:Reverse transcriptase n=1 Tax=Gossypium arboreum TaxID=29729 RepID=A0ABR0QAB6_GOSAR|nr:hypothetical protein PVK06_011961 [Gossypium arboreum]
MESELTRLATIRIKLINSQIENENCKEVLNIDGKETRVSGVKADLIIANLGFQFSHHVEAIGFSGGIWIGWKRPFFTWHSDVVFERLDRAIGNDEWIYSFQNWSVTHLPILKSNHRPLLLEIDVQEGFENVLHHKDLIWKQKVKCDWLLLKDRNTKSYHQYTLQRIKQNWIMALENGLGEWIFYEEELQNEAIRFFQNLYGEKPESMRSLPPSLFPWIAEGDF